MYRVGQRVWLYNPRRKKGLSPKLQSPWDGPWEVVEALTDVTFRIRRGAKQRSRVVHSDRLWNYTDRGQYTWEEGNGPPDQASWDEDGDGPSDETSQAGNAPMTQEADRLPDVNNEVVTSHPAGDGAAATSQAAEGDRDGLALSRAKLSPHAELSPLLPNLLLSLL